MQAYNQLLFISIVLYHALLIVTSRPKSLIHHDDVEGVLGLGECEHIPFQWPHVSLLTQGTLQVRIRYVRQRNKPTLEQTNKSLLQYRGRSS